MPANVVKTATDEAAWKRAKAQAKKQGQAKNYAYIMGIYKQMRGEKSMTALLAGGYDELRKAQEVPFDPHRNDDPNADADKAKYEKRARYHSRMAREHQQASTSGNQMGRWAQSKAHDDAIEAHRAAAEANREAITNDTKRGDANDASDEASSHPRAGEVGKSMSVLDQFDELIKAAGGKIGKGLPFPPAKSGSGSTLPGEEKLQKKGGKPFPPKAQAKNAKAAEDDEDGDEDGAGTLDHHKGQALAHLQAAQAHATAAQSAKKVEEAKDHKNAVSAAQAASEATLSGAGGSEVEKSGGEGSRGGHIIGHHPDGKPIYESSKAVKEALRAHNSGKEFPSFNEGYNTSMKLGSAKARGMMKRIASDKHGIFGGGKGKISQKDLDAHLRVLASKSASQKVEKSGGEGSRGGKILGHTSSGKPIYGSANHPDHASFSGEDHKAAEALHRGKQRSIFESAISKYEQSPEGKRRGVTTHKDALGAMTADQRDQADHHGKQANEHMFAGNKSIRKGDLRIDINSEDAALELLEKGMVIGGQAARGGRLQKGGISGGTIYQGEHDAMGSRGADHREEYARAQVLSEMVTLDEDGTEGNGGLPEWFQDSYKPSSDDVRVPLGMGALPDVVKSDDYQVIDDSDPYTRAINRSTPDHSSSAALFFRGGERGLRRNS